MKSASLLPPDALCSFSNPAMGPVHSICFHGSARILAGTRKGAVYLWDLDTNRTVMNFIAGSNAIMSIHHTLQLLITQEKCGKVIIWEISAQARYVPQRTFNTQYMGYCRTILHRNCKISAGGGIIDVTNEYLFYPAHDNVIVCIDINRQEAEEKQLQISENELPYKVGTVMALKAFEYNECIYLLAGYESGHLLTWNLETCTIMASHNAFSVEHEILAIEFDSATNCGIVCGPTDQLITISYCWSTMELRMCSTNRFLKMKNSGINCVYMRPDRKIFATGGWDSHVRIYSWSSLRPLAVLTEHKAGGISDIAFSNERIEMWKSKIMATAGFDGQILLWNLY